MRHVVAACLGALTLIAAGLSAWPAVASASTSTSVTITEGPSPTYAAASYLDVTVTASSGPNPTSGTVTVSDSFGGFSCSLSLSGSDEVTCNGTYWGAGSDTLSATYGGSGSYSGSEGSTTVSVAKASTTLSISASATTVGESTTVTGQFSPSYNNDGGTLVITDSAEALDCSIDTATSALTCTSGDFTAVTSDTISASWSGNSDVNSTSASTTLDVTQAPTLVSSVTATPSEVGETSSITVQVSPHPDGGDVSLSDADNQIGPACASVPIDTANGQASCTTATLTTADANDTISAVYEGDADYSASPEETGNLDVARGTTTLTITADPDPAVGSTATYTATVSPSGAGSTGGSVAFSDSGSRISDCGTEAVNTATDQAACTSLDYSSVGSDEVSASWSGTTNWAPSSDQTSFPIGQGSPNVSVSLSPSSPRVGQTVTITAVVSPGDGGGSVAFTGNYIGSDCSAVALSGNSASCTTGTLSAVGSWTVTATYSGDTNYESAFGGKSVTIAAAATTVSLSSNPTTPYAFSSDTLTASVTPVPDGGSVTFSDQGGPLPGCSQVAVSTTSGSASCPVAGLPGAGIDDLTASFSGDSNYQASSGELELDVVAIPTTVVVSASPNPVTVGETSTLTVTVDPVPDGGTVSVLDGYGDLTCSSVAVSTTSGTASCVTRALSPGGSDSLSVSYSGDANYSASGGVASITVERISSTTQIAPAAPGYGVLGSQLQLSATVTPPPAAGVVSFSDSLGQLPSCSSVPVDPSTGVASCASADLSTTGQDRVTATFAQTPTEASSSVSTTISIDAPPSFGSGTLTETVGGASSATLDVGGYPAPSVTANAAMPSGLSLEPDGSITGTPAEGTGGVYLYVITATNLLASAQVTLTIVVNQAPTLCTSTSLQAAYGQEVSFELSSCPGTYPTASFALSGAVPSGMTFSDNGNGTASIAGTPGDYVSGEQTFSVRLSNSAGDVLVPMSIDVTGTPPPPTTTTTVTAPSSSDGTTLSPVAAALIAHREAAVASSGVKPSVSEKGALPSSYDPLAPTRTVRKNGELISEPIVVLGPDDRFPTLGNTGPYGDCAVVADSNIVRVDHIEKRIRSVPAMTTNEALAEWAAIDGGTGAGLTDAQLLHAWAGSAGLLGTRLRGWRQLGTGHLTALKRAMEASGALYVGILLPSAGTTGDTIDPTMTATTEVSGHALALYGWTPRGFLAVTWGESVLIPYSWWTSYSTTAYALKILQKTPPARKPAAG